MRIHREQWVWPDWGVLSPHNSIRLRPTTRPLVWRVRHWSCPHSIHGSSRALELLWRRLYWTVKHKMLYAIHHPRSRTLYHKVHLDNANEQHRLGIPLHLESTISGIKGGLTADIYFSCCVKYEDTLNVRPPTAMIRTKCLNNAVSTCCVWGYSPKNCIGRKLKLFVLHAIRTEVYLMALQNSTLYGSGRVMQFGAQMKAYGGKNVISDL